MRKFLILILTALSLAFCVSAVACTTPENSDENGGGQVCQHQYTSGYFLEDNKMYIGEKCSICDEIKKENAQVIEVDVVIAENNNKMSSVNSGDVVAFKKGAYNTVTAKRNVESVIYIAETGVTVNSINATYSKATYENFTVLGHASENAFNFPYDVSDVTVKNCYFTEYGGIYSRSAGIKITNLTVDNCVFKDITAGLSEDEKRDSAIVITRYDGLTVKNCSFENVSYNAMQVGEHENGGEVLIENNVFKNMGSRVVYLVRTDRLTDCLVAGNTFYNHDHVYSDPEAGHKKDSGIYIHCKSETGIIKVGVNTWETVPEFDRMYIAPVAEYNQQEQLVINAE